MSAVGKNGSNVKRIAETLRKKIKIISMPSASDLDKNPSIHIKNFIAEVVSPIEFTNFDFIDNVASISGTRESKAILIGRDRCREKELSEVLKKIFGVKEFKIV